MSSPFGEAEPGTGSQIVGMTHNWKAGEKRTRDLGKEGPVAGRPSSPQFPPILFSCLLFLNFADLTFSEPGTG